jgi:hypothetical protein
MTNNNDKYNNDKDKIINIKLLDLLQLYKYKTMEGLAKTRKKLKHENEKKLKK